MTYEFAAWVLNLVCTQSLADPTMELRADGVQIAGPLSLPESPGNWTLLTGTFTASSATTVLEITSLSTAFSGNDFGTDDVSLFAADQPDMHLGPPVPGEAGTKTPSPCRARSPTP